MIGPSRHFVRRRLAAYSLVEMMIAMGVLAIALPMVATAFLAGALENASSADSTMGTLVAENALAIVRARVTHGDLVTEFGTGKMGPTEIPQTMVPRERLEWNPDRGTPADDGTGEGVYGCVVAVQRLDNDVNDYRLIAVPFRKFQPENELKGEGLTLTVEEDGEVSEYKVELVVSKTETEVIEESAEIGLLVQRTALRP